MMLYLIKFDFIELSTKPINGDEEKFYCSTIKALTSDNKLSLADSNNVTIPIPITQLQSANASYILKDEFNKWIVKAGLLSKDGGLINNSFFISLDITKNRSDKLCIQLYYFLSEILLLSKIEGDIKFFIFLDILPTVNDVLWEPLKTNVNKGLIFLINVRDGEFLPQKTDEKYDIVRFKEKRKILLLDKKSLLKQKLIRKLGHFKIDGKDNFCYPYFYDGSYCEEEISSLLSDYIESSISCGQFELIVYAAKYSPWLIRSIARILIGLKTIAFENIDECINEYKGGNLLFITDLINSGDSLIKMITELSEKMQNLDNDKIHILSILNSGNGKESTENKRKITINNYDFQITYFVDVKIDLKITKDNCEMCKLDLPFDEIENEIIPKFTSYNFWSLSDKAGYGPEEYGRDPDKLMKKITKMNNWFDENSAYMVYKYMKLLESIDIDAKYGSIFIYPKEKVTVDNPTPSNRLAESFKNIFNAKEIGIPRDLIDTYKDKNAPIDAIDDIQDDWILTIKKMPHDLNYVIIDEFHKGGETFESIMRILKKLNRNPKCFFPIINFNPQKKEEYMGKYGNLKILSLYEFDVG